MKVLLLILKFLFIGALFIISNNQLYLSDSSDMITFKNMYSEWIGSIFDSFSTITSFVVQSDWLPQDNLSK